MNLGIRYHAYSFSDFFTGKTRSPDRSLPREARRTVMKIVSDDRPEVPEAANDTPALRLFSLLEVLAARDRRPTLQELVTEMGLPKPTVHRMLQQLETAGMLQRDADGRRYGLGWRMRRLSERLLLNDSLHGARHQVLRRLVEEVGESCNITALSGSDVIYLDRVETAAPLRFYLHAGSRVPVHCSASGKLLLSQMSPAQRRRLLGALPLEAYTANTLTRFDQLEEEIHRIRQQGYAVDNEEFLPGLVCIATLVPNESGASSLCVALQAPVMRLDVEGAVRLLPALQQAAGTVARIEQETEREAAGSAHA